MKKAGLGIFKEILQKYVYKSIFMSERVFWDFNNSDARAIFIAFVLVSVASSSYPDNYNWTNESCLVFLLLTFKKSKSNRLLDINEYNKTISKTCSKFQTENELKDVALVRSMLTSNIFHLFLVLPLLTLNNL